MTARDPPNLSDHPTRAVAATPPAATPGLALTRVAVRVQGDFTRDPAVSTRIVDEVDIDGGTSDHELDDLVDEIAKIPNSLRQGTAATLRRTARAATRRQLHADLCGSSRRRARRSVGALCTAMS